MHHHSISTSKMFSIRSGRLVESQYRLQHFIKTSTSLSVVETATFNSVLVLGLVVAFMKIDNVQKGRWMHFCSSFCLVHELLPEMFYYNKH